MSGDDQFVVNGSIKCIDIDNTRMVTATDRSVHTDGKQTLTLSHLNPFCIEKFDRNNAGRKPWSEI